jgi:hypothetical protein
VSRDIDPQQPSSDRPRAEAIRRARRLLLIPAAVCALQAIGLLVFAIGALLEPSQGVTGAVVEAAVLGLLAAGLIIIGVGLLRLKAWARGPLIAVQLIALLTAVAYVGLSEIPGAVLAAASVAAIAVVIVRPVGEVMEGVSPFDDGSSPSSSRRPGSGD